VVANLKSKKASQSGSKESMKKRVSAETASLMVKEIDTGKNPPSSLHPLLRTARAVLFDVGGTLTHPDWARLALIAGQETGGVFEPTEMRRALCERLREFDAQLFATSVASAHSKRPGWLFHDMFRALGVDEEACERLATKLLEAHEQKHLWCGLDPQAAHVVARLKSAGLRVGVISNTEDGRVEELLEMMEIAAHFELLIDSHLVGLRKPETAIFSYALERLNVAADDAVYVGDSYGHDVQGARRAGLRAILLDPLDLYQESDCARIHSLSELTGDAGY
jgi:putative hydrolase of the HAD superfamily